MKALFRAHGVRVPCGAVISYETENLVDDTHACLRQILHDMSYFEDAGKNLTPGSLGPFTVIAKNAASDASEGITQANVIELQPNTEDGGATYQIEPLVSLVRNMQSNFHQNVLVEQYIAGREFNLSVLERWEEDPTAPSGARRTMQLLPLAEMLAHPTPEAVAKGFRNIMTYEAKWIEGTHDYDALGRQLPAENVSPALEAELRRAALGAFRALGLVDYARVDIRVDSHERAYVLEANYPPCLELDTGFPCCLEEAHIPFPTFLSQVLYNAQLRARLGRLRKQRVRNAVAQAAEVLGDRAVVQAAAASPPPS
eukprot:GAFH01002050.1.p1 GENE.GAFH01002050.1~~GAFH01002050.1.p1  ORF type:complete len:347 (-),score=80.11 GAFH01002050.1:270-1208(-)